MRKVGVAAAIIIMMSGCQESALLHHSGIVRPSNSTTYREGERQVANVGDYMTSTVQFEVWQAIRSPQSVEATTTHHGNTWELVAPAGEYVLAGKSPEGMFYLSREQLKCSAREAWGGLFVPQGSSTPSEIVFTWAPWSRFGDRPFNLYGAPIKSATTLAPAKSLLEPINADFVATLSYAGVSGGQIKFVYKEFNLTSDRV
jgi:hypothetical protein